MTTFESLIKKGWFIETCVVRYRDGQKINLKAQHKDYPQQMIHAEGESLDEAFMDFDNLLDHLKASV